jgi:hypothetical protein
MILPNDSPKSLPGDPAQLRLAAVKLSDASAELINQALELHNTTAAINSRWVGAASTMWRKLAQVHYDQIMVAADALRDTCAALYVYASKLEPAQHDYATSTARADAMTSKAIVLATQPAGDAHTTAKRDADIADYQADARKATQIADGAFADARAAAHVAAAEFHAIAARAPSDLGRRTLSTACTLDGHPTEAALTLLLSTVRVNADGVAVELDLENAMSLNGASPRAIIAMAQALGWEHVKAAKEGGGGVIYYEPGTNKADGIRVMNGDPKAPDPVKSGGPYVRVTHHSDKSDATPLEGNVELDRPSQLPAGPWARAKPVPDAQPGGPFLIPGKAGNPGPPPDQGDHHEPGMPDPHPIEVEIPQIQEDLWP